MNLAMLMVGLLFGIALSLTVALFAVLSLGDHFQENLKAASLELRAWVTGRKRKAMAPTPARSLESETRARTLQEEIRVMQRLLDQARVERETHDAEKRKAAEEIAALRAAAGERDERLAGMETMMRDENARTGKMREELEDLAAQLARSKRETKDLETELSLLQSGAGMSAISDEIARLSAERDELTARLERMTRPVVVAK